MDIFWNKTFWAPYQSCLVEGKESKPTISHWITPPPLLMSNDKAFKCSLSDSNKAITLDVNDSFLSMPFSQGQVVNFIWLEKQQTSLDHQYLEKAEMVMQGSLYQACLLHWMVVPSLEMLHLINKQQHLMSSAFPLVLHLPPQIQTDLLYLLCFKTGTLLRRKEIRLSAYPHRLCRSYWCAMVKKMFEVWLVSSLYAHLMLYNR